MLTFRTQDLGHCEDETYGSILRIGREEAESAHLPDPKPNEERKDGAEEKSVKSRVVERSLSELSFRSDQAPTRRRRERNISEDSREERRYELIDLPQDRSGEKDSRSRASERVRRFVHADVFRRGEEPLLDSDLNEARSEDDDDLDWGKKKSCTR